jgi:PAS domain S-box-containing protein
MLLITLYVLAGVCLYAAIHHLWIARHLSDRTHLWFALLCLVVTFYVLVKAGAYRAATVAELVSLRRWEVSLGIMVVGLLPWFALAYTGMRQRALPAALTVLLGIFLAANLILPYGVSFIEPPMLGYLTLPWGEQVADLRAHQRSIWFNAGWVAILLNFVFTGYVCARQYRQGQQRKALALGLALGAFLAFVLFNQVVNFGLVNFTHTAEFGFIALVLLMSAALSSELRRSAEARTTSEAALRASVVLQRAILDYAGHAIISTSVNGMITSFNRAAERMLGYRVEEVVGRATPAVFHDPAEVGARAREFSAALGSDIEPGFEVFVAKARRDLPNEHEWTYIRKDGSRFPVLLTVTTLRDAHGEVTGFLGLAIDITERKHTEQALHASEERLRMILQTEPECVKILAADGTLLEMNPAGLAMIEAESLAQVQGRKVANIVAPEHRAAFVSLSRRVSEKGESGKLEFEIIGLKGTRRWLETNAVPMRDEASGKTWLLGVTRDITERKRTRDALQRSAEQLQTVFEASPATINISRLDNGTILYVNRAWEVATGWPRAMAIGHPATELALWPDVAVREALRARVRQTESVRNVEWQRRARTGEVHTVLGSITRIEIDGAECALTFTQDITERKRVEAELARYREHLEELVEARTNALEAANHELEAFSYSVSHDLRAPLRSINGFSQALAEEYADKLDATAMDYLNRVRQGALRMGELIDDLLKLSRVTRQDLRGQNVNLSALATEIAAELRAREPGRVVDWSLAPQVLAAGDPHLLRIVMDNLLGNAWKYTSRTEHARIEFGIRPDDGNAVYYVRDNGAGFDMQYADRLFGAFQRLHKVEDFPGNGIGLATVKRIVVRHGGRIWAESQPGQGATFYFTLARTEGVEVV